MLLPGLGVPHLFTIYSVKRPQMWACDGEDGLARSEHKRRSEHVSAVSGGVAQEHAL